MTDLSAGKSMTPGSASIPEAKPAADAGAKRGFLGTSQVRDYGLLIALLLITLFFEYATNGVLFQPLNLTNLILQNSYVVVMALGMLLVIVAGHIDLSIGSIVGFVGALAALLMVRVGLDPLSATVICLAVGAAIGGVQGAFVAYLGIPSFIVTLAGMLVFRGLTLALLQGASIGPFPEVFQLLAKGFLINFAGPWTSVLIGAVLSLILFGMNWQRRVVQVRHGSQPDSLAAFVARNGITTIVILAFAYQMSAYRGLPNVLIVMFVLVMLYRFITTRTTIGRRIYALGGNIKAARLSGIKTERLTFLTFANMGALAGLAGMIFAARLNTATPKAGVGFELDVIAACFIGGASAAGGIGKVSGVVIGAFIIGVMNNGMSILGIGIDYQQVIKGIVLLAAVCLDVYNKKNRA
ncbi:multiple monosaccharide ABC transporter membrane protein [Methylobacterium pseudosasicola]|uniref:Xylose transport system permease protein XylH n=2 Tax=Methylobacterium pseudosasicola TaxID=582667 RepID=A0A1I4KPV1_9HYPH|nr:multiple monosaccharide ABC transporter permease [Methylobacterium pseudosasicola]SFL80579.1 multiple monosaccharide ABC transporter membrane protein [Methylobacterium pseudosasicola]